MTNRETIANKEMPALRAGTSAAFRVGNYADIIAEFRLAMRAAGINYSGEIITDGRLHRFHIPGHTPGTLNGAYTLHMDGRPAGFFQNFCDPGSKQTWRYQGEISGQTKVNPSMLRMHRQKKIDDLAQRQEEAALKAIRTWEAAKPAPANHPYLVKKDIKPHGLRVLNGDLVVPLINADLRLSSLQFIRPDGQKRFLAGGRKKECFFYIGDGSEVDRFMICEGVATGASLYEYSGWHVIVAFDTGNLDPVARLFRSRYPNDIIAIAGDNDGESGIGQAAAHAAAEAIGAQVMIPRLPGDWNDWKSSIRRAL